MTSTQTAEADASALADPPNDPAPDAAQEGVTPAVDVQAEIQAALAEQKAVIEQQIKEATGHDSLDALLAAQRQAQEGAEAKTQEAAMYRTLYEQTSIKAAVLASAGQAINPDMVLTLLSGQAVVSGDGSVSINGQPAKEAVEAFLKANPFMAKPTGGAGSGAPVSGGTMAGYATNPWRREHLNLTEQSRIARDNPTEAARLKAAAGV
ncbi:MAG: hypothetical protein EPN21_09285 [Methylococcaceae bacterium]|nr:MAG: hypothetical protein EPN21_09285 [Methylococcaceae bacterium]